MSDQDRKRNLALLEETALEARMLDDQVPIKQIEKVLAEMKGVAANDAATAPPELRKCIASLERYLADRNEALLKIDPDTAELKWMLGECFARSPGSDMWFSFDELPDAIA